MRVQITRDLFRRLGWLFLSLVLLVLLWAAIYRITSPGRSIRLVELPDHRRQSSISSESLRVAAFNIAHGRGGKFGASNWQDRSLDELRLHLDQIAVQIQRSGADIVVLNEVDFRSTWSRNLNQAAYIAERAGYRYLVEQRNIDVSIPWFSLQFGNALLSHHPVESAERIEFQPYSRWQRILAGNHDGLLARVQTPSGPVAVAGVHLEVRSEHIRWLAAQRLHELRDESEIPFVVMGDFNSTPQGFPRSQVSSQGHNALDHLLDTAGFNRDATIIGAPPYFTFPSEGPRAIIDWILVGRGLELSDSAVVASDLSDHLMVTASLCLRPCVSGEGTTILGAVSAE